MKSINLVSLIRALNALPTELFNSYKESLGITNKNEEIKDIEDFINTLSDHTEPISIVNNMFVGFNIPQISKEFDLLRFSDDLVINIEIKRKASDKKIKKQLVENQFYLKFLKLSILSYTYIIEEEQLYTLDDEDNLTIVHMDTLIEDLQEQNSIDLKNISDKFDPTNYLVSPFNATDRFIENEFFLTDHQRNIIRDFFRKPTRYLSIEGTSGTGKSLVSYALAKELQDKGEKVAIFHCARLNEGHAHLSDNPNWNIYPIKSFSQYTIQGYDVILIDEAQRLKPNQFNILREYVETNEKRCIFSYDPQQWLHTQEMQHRIPDLIEELPSNTQETLTDKIRSNKEIASFIKALFNLRRINKDINYPNVDFSYFDNNNEALLHLDNLHNDNWEVINLTPSTKTYNHVDEYSFNEAGSAHSVIGQEFDNVAVIIDKFFYYDGTTHSLTYRGRHYYHAVKMVYQITTRARKKLHFVVVDNPHMLEKLLKIKDEI